MYRMPMNICVSYLVYLIVITVDGQNLNIKKVELAL